MAFPTPFNINTILGVPGPQGPPGSQGVPGKAHTTTTSSFTQPAVNATVAVGVLDSSFIGVGQYVNVATGGTYIVTVISSSVSITLQNTGAPGNASPTTVIAISQTLTVSGPQGSTGATGATGATGTAGQSAFTTTTSSYTQPAVNSTVSIAVTSSAWLTVGASAYVTNGGTYTVTAIADSTHFTGKNLGYTGSASPSSTVATAQKVVATGLQGLSGRTCIATVGPAGSNADYITTGTSDEVQINAALSAVNDAGGGEVVIRAGTYHIGASIEIFSKTTLKGENKYGVNIATNTSGSGQTITGGVMLHGTDLSHVTVSDLLFSGVGVSGGACAGILFELSVAVNTGHINLIRLRFNGLVGDGINIDTPIVSMLEDVRVNGCTGNGFNLHSGTSTTLLQCYAQSCSLAGFYINAMTYSNLISCAGETSGFNYQIHNGGPLLLLSCGSEIPTDISSSYPGAHFKIENSQNVTAIACYGTGFSTGAGSGNKGYISLAGTTINCRFVGFNGTTGVTGVTPTYTWRVNTGAQLILEQCGFAGLGATTTSGVLIKEETYAAGVIKYKSLDGDSRLDIDRFSSGFFGTTVYKTNAVSQWASGMQNDSTSDFQIKDIVNSRIPLKIVQSTGLVTASVGFDANSTEIINVTDPTSAQHAATKNYVDTNALTAAGTATLTNKRITKRVATLTDAATVTPATDSFDGGELLSLSQTTNIANPTGTPVDFDRYEIRITSSAAQSLTWGANFTALSGFSLPTATTGSSTTDIFFFAWNSTTSKWQMTGSTQSSASVTASSTTTFTNKRITKRVETLTDAATVTFSSDSFDGGKLLTLSQTTTFANPSGTPTPFQQYVLRVKSTTQRALSWGGQFRGSTDIPLPATNTGSSKTDYMGFQWNADDSTWDLIALVRGF